jgi:hypothetical protein
MERVCRDVRSECDVVWMRILGSWLLIEIQRGISHDGGRLTDPITL